MVTMGLRKPAVHFNSRLTHSPGRRRRDRFYVDVKKKVAVSPPSGNLLCVAFYFNMPTICFNIVSRRSGPELQDGAQPRFVAILHLARLHRYDTRS
jgi:hypothetical protein